MVGTAISRVRSAIALWLLLQLPSLPAGPGAGSSHRLPDVWAATVCGDVSGDGVVNIDDALLVSQVATGLRRCGELPDPGVCDVNGDGACDIQDALIMLQLDVGLIAPFTCRPYTCPPPPTTVFVIVMENHNWSSIKGNASAPYINDTLLPLASHAEQYYNPPNVHPSEPNYLWLEAGTNFGILDDGDPASNHQRTGRHLVNLLEAAGLSWRAYQEDISGTDCPLTERGLYHVDHNPFVYFDDVTQRNDPQAARCIEHVRPYSELDSDLINDTVASYNFITPDVCHDMHDACAPLNDPVQQGDMWLSTEVPKILASRAYAENGALFIVWDEAKAGDGPIGMILLSPKAKGGGYQNTIRYTHSSMVRTIEEIFGVSPLLGEAANAIDLSDLFASFP